MRTITVGVAIPVPAPWSDELSAWRHRAGDPEAERVLPHVTLLPPTPVAADWRAIQAHLGTVAAGFAPFEVRLAGTATFRPRSDVVYVTVAEGAAECTALAAAVRSGPLARELAHPYHPHVTVAHDVPAAGLDLAQEGLAGFAAAFPVPGFAVFEQVDGGVWESKKEFVLRGS
jgi:2'-5' RNA ligase